MKSLWDSLAIVFRLSPFCFYFASVFFACSQKKKCTHTKIQNGSWQFAYGNEQLASVPTLLKSKIFSHGLEELIKDCQYINCKPQKTQFELFYFDTQNCCVSIWQKDKVPDELWYLSVGHPKSDERKTFYSLFDALLGKRHGNKLSTIISHSEKQPAKKVNIPKDKNSRNMKRCLGCHGYKLPSEILCNNCFSNWEMVNSSPAWPFFFNIQKK